MSRAVRHASPRSLLLVDEFGKGTASVDGAAVLGACVKHLASKTEGAVPRVAVATHFREIADPEWLGLSPRVMHCFHMQVLVQEDDTVHPLFRLAPGRAKGSYGIACAKAAGASERFLERAERVFRLLQSGDPAIRLRDSSGALPQIVAAARLIVSSGGELSPGQVCELRKLIT
jgi:DNA mismatch repair protein MSH5